MSVQTTIEEKLANGLAPEHLEVINESGNHNVPPGSESHFKVVVVSDEFEDKTLVARHQLVYRLLDKEMREQIHALALHTYSPADWHRTNPEVTQSPPCLGGGESIQR